MRSCCSDPRVCRPGDVYVAIVDADGDGHDEVDKAVQRGAVAVVSERLVPTRVPCCVVPDSREAYGHICQRLAGQPDQSLRLVGVTGTHGKTTTAMLITAVLQAARAAGGRDLFAGIHATARPRRRPRRRLRRRTNWLAGWHRWSPTAVRTAWWRSPAKRLATRRLSGVSFDAAVLTNLRREHLDLHGNVWTTIGGPSSDCSSTSSRADSPSSTPTMRPASSMLESLHVPLITVGMHRAHNCRRRSWNDVSSEQTFLLTAGQECVPVRTRTIGDQFVYCCLSAAAVGLVMGLDLTTIVRGLESLDTCPGRLERLECGQDFSVFVDHAQTPSALALSLHAMRQVTPGRVICVYGATQWQDMEQRAAMGRVAERGADVGVITSNNPGHEPPLQIAHDILSGFRNPGKAHIIPDRKKAIHWALSDGTARRHRPHHGQRGRAVPDAWQSPGPFRRSRHCLSLVARCPARVGRTHEHGDAAVSIGSRMELTEADPGIVIRAHKRRLPRRRKLTVVMAQLSIEELNEIVRGQLSLGTMPPVGGMWAPVGPDDLRQSPRAAAVMCFGACQDLSATEAILRKRR